VVLKWKSTFIYCHFDICTPLKLINQNQIEFPNNTPFADAVLFYTEDTIGNEKKIPHQPNSSIFQFEIRRIVFRGLYGGTSAANKNVNM